MNLFVKLGFSKSCDHPKIICQLLCACVKTYFFRENPWLSQGLLSDPKEKALRTTGYENVGCSLIHPGGCFHLTKILLVHLPTSLTFNIKLEGSIYKNPMKYIRGISLS